MQKMEITLSMSEVKSVLIWSRSLKHEWEQKLKGNVGKIKITLKNMTHNYT